MSLIRITSKYFTIAPRVYFKRESLHLETPLWLAGLLLFLRLRHIEIDKKRKYVQVSTRWFWFFNVVRLIPFRHIKCVYYDYEEVPNSGVLYHGFAMATDSLEDYRIGLVLNHPDDERVYLFRVAGEGAKMTGLFGVLLGDSPVDLQGNQQQQSLGLASLLSKFLGVPLGAHNR